MVYAHSTSHTVILLLTIPAKVQGHIQCVELLYSYYISFKVFILKFYTGCFSIYSWAL